MDPTRQVIMVGGHRLTLTHLDKVLYPETGTTKADVLSYYATIAHALIPYARERPATRKRWVHGVGTESAPGPMFFQKNVESGAPEWIERGTVRHSDHTNEYPVVNDLATLTWLAQMGALEIHVPQWRFNEAGGRQNPDRLVLDLDPGPGVSLAACAEVAILLRDVLSGMGLDSVPVTSGSAGIHVYAALDLRSTSAQVSAVAHELARAMEADHPDLTVSTMRKSARAGRVFIDWSQNNSAKTTIAPYSLRGRTHPTVAAPRTWAELAAAHLQQLDYTDVMRRVTGGSDPLARLYPDASLDKITVQAEERRRASVSLASEDRLATYRAKRDAAHTPEPIPGPSHLEPRRGGEPAFVVHEHHARRLHWDLRVEHDGVLACWALPRGIPTSSAHNHLAVHTEDHPIEYLGFEGTIPAGHYGAGTMWVWDSGTAEVEKWRDDEVIVTLHPAVGGGLGGPRRLALIHTGGEGRADNNWLIHLMKADAAPRRATAAGVAHPEAPTYSPMLATSGTTADLRPEQEWAIEMKWDGIRLLAAVTGDPPERAVHLRTRNGLDATRDYPEIVSGLRNAVLAAGSTMFDGELVALDSVGRPDFARLQSRMLSSSASSRRTVSLDPPVTYLVFDILERGGQSLMGRGYDDRRRLLLESLAQGDAIRIPAAFDGDVEAALRTSRDLGLEGIVAKRHDGTYRSGRRSRSWIKIAQRRTQEVVIGGWRPGRGNRAATIGSLLLGIPRGASLDYVGRVGTGFRDRDLVLVRKLLNEAAASDSPFSGISPEEARDAAWVRPDLVGEVEFAEWTPAGRLRHPSWRGWRPDKSPKDITRE